MLNLYSTYNGVKYYGPYDWSLGHAFERAKDIMNAFDDQKEYTDINEIIELENVREIMHSSGIKAEYSGLYREQAKKLTGIVAKFFKNINDDSLLSQYLKVDYKYIDDFWSLFERFTVFDLISDNTFQQLLNNPGTLLRPILQHNKIVKKYDKIIADNMRHSDQTAGIIIEKFLEKERDNSENRYFLPLSLRPEEFELILNKYIDFEDANIGRIALIARSQSTKECPISDALRLKARRKEKEFWSSSKNNTVGFNYVFAVSFCDNPEVFSFRRTKQNEFRFNYDANWIDYC